MNLAPIFIAFVTGLTTGGLSCYAVQGGLLTSSIAAYTGGKKGKSTRLAQPILLFLSTKLIVHALFGLLLGAVGTLLSPSPVVRGLLQVAVGVFMIGNALRMLDVHPIFRVFTFEPPKSVTRYIRRKAKKGQEWTTPVFLGALTLLIPCGVTQIMMAAAVTAGSPWMGSAILTAFVLGASPAFFGVTYLAVKISALFEKQFTRVLAIIILLLGVYTFDTGLNLAGSPVSISRSVAWFLGEPVQPVNAAAQSGDGALPQVLVDGLSTPDPSGGSNSPSAELRINVLNSGYSPAISYAKAGQPVRLHLLTKGVYSCSRAFVIPGLNFEQFLPDTGETIVEIPAQPAGTQMRYMCSMGMYIGKIVFE